MAGVQNELEEMVSMELKSADSTGKEEQVTAETNSFTLKRLLMVSVVLLLELCAVLMHQPVESQYTYEWFARLHGANASKPAPRPGCDVTNGSSHGNESETLAQRDSSQFLVMTYVASGENKYGDSTMLCACGVPAFLMNLLIGAYSDRVGRKVVLVMCGISRLLMFLVTVAVVLWHLDVRFMLLGIFLDGLSGSTSALFLAAYAYTADVTPPSQRRTVALAAIDAVTYIVGASVSLGTGFLIARLGYVYAVSVSALITVVQIFFTVFFVKESLPNRQKSAMTLTCSSFGPETLKGIKGIFKFYFVKEKSRNRALFWFGLIVFFLLIMTGSTSVGSLYEMGPPFCWDSVRIGYYTALSDFSGAVFSVVGLRLLQVCLKDDVIGAFGLLSSIGSNLLKGFATTSLMLYLSPLVGLSAGATMPVVRSLMSSMVTAQEQGALFASMSILRVVFLTVGHALTSWVYQATLTSMRGAVYLFMASVRVLMLALMTSFIIISRKHHREMLKEATVHSEETQCPKDEKPE